MIETWIIAFIIAKIKKLKIKPLFKHWSIYPSLIMVIFYIFLEITIWIDWPYFIPYQKIIKWIILLSYLPLIFEYKIYFKGAIAVGCTIIGSILNTIVTNANNGLMPVFPTLTKTTGYFKDFYDTVHVIGNQNTKFIFLADIFDTGYCIMSIGDIFFRIYVLLILYFSIKEVNKLVK